MYTVARKPERLGGKIDVVGSTVDLEHLLNGHDGRLYPRGVHRLLARVLAPCSVHGDSYRRQEARVGRYDTMRSQEYLGAFVPLNMNTTRVGNACCLLVRAIVLRSMPWRRGHRRLHVANGMLDMG